LQRRLRALEIETRDLDRRTCGRAQRLHGAHPAARLVELGAGNQLPGQQVLAPLVFLGGQLGLGLGLLPRGFGAAQAGARGRHARLGFRARARVEHRRAQRIEHRQGGAHGHRVADIQLDAAQVPGHRRVQDVAVDDPRAGLFLHGDAQRPARDLAGLDQHRPRPESPRRWPARPARPG
jgi:hypothetical protein